MSSKPGTSSGSSAPVGKEVEFQEFYTEVKQIEKRDSVLTPVQQIERLLRAGSTYFNLNPFEVLNVDPDQPLDEIRTKYKRLSILVHPDKNMDDRERAQLAFEAVNKAWKTLENEETRQKCMDIIEEAKARTDINVQEKKKKLKKEGKSTRVEEDDPEKLKHAVYVLTMKLFADLERKKRTQEQRDMEDRKRKREDEIEQEEKSKFEKEWLKNYEDSREGRVASWKNFQTGASKKKEKKEQAVDKPAKKIKVFRPPKHKPESK
ncbi:dnaJ homolog subfamily C member 8 [Folsomia candida]|uniref:dnaJ homolog subfamily C member 8 n=1 Tax=Folsomia candida TaxID=158441 RepID=UPI000B9096EC|nr:dnaJ homolog subfamily C member 8 [Folsomia candida]